MSLIVVVVIVTALSFDFTNGFHDTANSMATSVATGALRPRVAVLASAVLNLVGAFLSIQVAKTVTSGLVDEARITPTIIFAGLVAAVIAKVRADLRGSRGHTAAGSHSSRIADRARPRTPSAGRRSAGFGQAVRVAISARNVWKPAAARA